MDNTTQRFAKKLSFIRKGISTNDIVLISILIVAAILRFHKLTFQSLWYDEIQTMFNSDPKLNWSKFLDVMKNGDGVNTPFFFICEHIAFCIFGYTDLVARALSATAGVASVWAIYLLGSEIKNNKLGLTAAAIMTVNYFCIFYAQEARMYAFLLFFTILSYLFFIRVIKRLKVIDAFFYCIINCILIYTHYFAFLVIISELLMSLIFLIQEKENKRKLFVELLVSNSITAIVFLPWLSRFLSVTKINQFWIKPLKPTFFIDFFEEYFFFSSNIYYFAIVFIVLYLVIAFFSANYKNIKSQPLALSLVFVTLSIAVSVGIPYIRSIMSISMLIPRYTIIILPQIFIAFAYGIELIPTNFVRYLVLLLFLYISSADMILKKKYYKIPTKTQYREVANFVTENYRNYPIINASTPAQQKYYLDKDCFTGSIVSGNQEKIIDSIMGRNRMDTFWFESIFIDKALNINLQKELEKKYFIIRDSSFTDAAIELYTRNDSIVKTLDYTDFDALPFVYGKENVVPVWSSYVNSKPFNLQNGRYKMAVLTNGTPLYKVFPHNNIYINDHKIGDFYSNSSAPHIFFFDQKQDTTITIKVDMDNDGAANGNDRNTFISFIYILKA